MSNLNKPLEEGYTLNFNDYINNGWKLFNREMGPFIGATILFLIIQVVISFIPVVNVLSNVLTYILYGGYFIYCRNILKGTNRFGDFFGGFNHFVNILVYLIILGLLFAPLIVMFFLFAIPFGDFFDLITSGGSYPMNMDEAFGNHLISNLPNFFLIITAIIALGIYIAVAFAFVIPLIVDGKMGFWQAMGLSRKVVGKKFFSFLAFWIVFYIVFFAGTIITCGVGILFLIPFSYCISFEMYDKIFKPYPEMPEAILEEG